MPDINVTDFPKVEGFIIHTFVKILALLVFTSTIVMYFCFEIINEFKSFHCQSHWKNNEFRMSIECHDAKMENRHFALNCKLFSQEEKVGPYGCTVIQILNDSKGETPRVTVNTR